MNLFRHIANIFNFFAPTSKFFTLKRTLYRLGGIKVGRDVEINGQAWFYGNGNVVIGDRSWIGPNCRFYTTSNTSIIIGEDCSIAPDVLFITGSHFIGDESRRAGMGYGANITVGASCWIAVRATILPNIIIGESSVVGAGALVASSIKNNVLAIGVPAKEIKEL